MPANPTWQNCMELPYSRKACCRTTAINNVASGNDLFANMSYPGIPSPMTTKSAYHSSVLETLRATGVCNTQHLDGIQQLLRTLTGECASDAPEVNGSGGCVVVRVPPLV